MTDIYYPDGEIDWEEFKKQLKQLKQVSKEEKKLICKKCGEVFYNKKYLGEYPLCKKHRNSFKE